MVSKSADAARKAAMTKKAVPAKKTGQSGYTGKVSPTVLAQVKKDGMAVALQKVATYKAPTSPYIEAAYRMYGKKKVDAVRNSPAVQKKLATAGTGGKNSPSTAQAAKSFVIGAIKNVPKIPAAAAKTIAQKAKKPGRGN